jgi:hypothetical protein
LALESLIEKLVGALLGGGPQAIIAILLLVITWLVVERRRLIKEIERKDDRIDKIVDDYHKGNMSLAEALNSLKLVLYEVKSKI